jgi:ornithine cyclodeaminase/alanine dehydrogenase-like protein (mu-crystallin family)
MNSAATTLVLSQRDVARLIDIESCIDVVEQAFRLHADGRTTRPGVLGTHVDGGGFHVKTAGLAHDRLYFAAKVNANFPANPSLRGLPTIQGAVLLFDAASGAPLAIMDSIEITRLRTAAASAVAAKHLSRTNARVLTMIGCGAQAAAHVRALVAVRRLERIFAFDTAPRRASSLADRMRSRDGIDVTPVDDYRRAMSESDIVVTCTPARVPIVGSGDLPPGVFVAAVGADSEDKHEIDVHALAECAVVADIIEQCAAIGELHHALEAGVMTLTDVRADLAGVVSGANAGRVSDTERVVFDSTGTALQDVAAAALAYERACERDAGISITLAEPEVT